MNLWETIASILTGLIICVPLVIKLVQVTREAVKKGSWNQLVALIAGYMEEAEKRFSDGATRKEWVMGMIRVSAKKIDYPLTDDDWVKISDMIDNLCEMAHVVNGPKEAD
jgi:hypothetical protein